MKIYNVLVLVAITFLTSCKGQVTNEQKDTPSEPLSLGTLVTQMDSNIWRIYQDSKDNYWFGSDGKGVYFYDGNRLINYTKKDGVAGNQVRGFQEDRSGNIFIETHGAVSKFDGEKFVTLTPEIPDVTLEGSEESNWKLAPNDLWFHSNINEVDVYRYDGESLIGLKLPRKDLDKAFETKVVGLGFKNMSSSPYSVFGIDKDKDGNMWFGTVVAGAFRYDGTSFLWIPEKELSTLPDGRVPGVRSMIQDRDGYFWLSNFISKYKVNDAGTSYEKLPGISRSNKYFNNRIPYFNSGLTDTHGNLWMTTYTGGVWKYDGTTLSNYPIVDGDKEVLLVSIYEDKKGTIWIGTQNAGVFKFNGETFDTFELLNK